MDAYSPKQILCPIDMSALSDLALKYAYVGAHHQQFEQGIVVGRTTERVLRHAPVPTLAVPYNCECLVSSAVSR